MSVEVRLPTLLRQYTDGTASVSAEGATIGAYSVITDSTLHEGVTVKPHSVLEGAEVGAGSDVGPFARLRPGSVLAGGVHIGNFVETKNAQIGRAHV